MGYTQSQAGHSLYHKSDNTNFTTLLVYSDDIVIAGNYMIQIQSVKLFLDQKLFNKDLAKLRYLLGLEISRLEEGIIVSQRKYTLELLEDTSYLSVKPSTIPLNSTIRLFLSDGAP